MKRNRSERENPGIQKRGVQLKLKDEFIYQPFESEALLIPVGSAYFKGLLRGNHTLGVILELLQSDRTEAELVRALKARFDAPEETLQRDVGRAIAELRKMGALEE